MSLGMNGQAEPSLLTSGNSREPLFDHGASSMDSSLHGHWSPGRRRSDFERRLAAILAGGGNNFRLILKRIRFPRIQIWINLCGSKSPKTA